MQIRNGEVVAEIGQPNDKPAPSKQAARESQSVASLPQPSFGGAWMEAKNVVACLKRLLPLLHHPSRRAFSTYCQAQAVLTEIEPFPVCSTWFACQAVAVADNRSG